MRDGLEVMEGLAAESLDMLIVDAGSNDATLAVSCPPAPFLEPGFLKRALHVLRPQGLLVLNCVTRSDSAFQTALQNMQVSEQNIRSISLATSTHIYLAAASSMEHDVSLTISSSVRRR